MSRLKSGYKEVEPKFYEDIKLNQKLPEVDEKQLEIAKGNVRKYQELKQQEELENQ